MNNATAASTTTPTHYLPGAPHPLGGHEAFTCQNIAVYGLPGVVLFPGSTLPIRFRHQWSRWLQPLLRKSRKDGRAVQFGVVTIKDEDDSAIAGRIGTLVTVIFVHETDSSLPSAHPLDEINITAKGIRRFRILSGYHEVSNVPMYTVEELRELPAPKRGDAAIKESFPPFLRRRAWPKPDIQRALLDKDLCTDDGLVMNSTDWSFWLAANLPSSQQEKCILLEIPSTAERLDRIRRELLTKKTFICCNFCSCQIAFTSSIIQVPSAEGISGAYVNPHGVVHQTMTVSNAQNIVLYGEAETRDSWFPGYAWTIMVCASCHEFLGWKFTSTGDQGLDFFFGISAMQMTTERTNDES